jgi:hypothetical protein
MAVHAPPSPRRLPTILLVAVIAAAACEPGDGESKPTSAATIAAMPTPGTALVPPPAARRDGRQAQPVRVTSSRAATTVVR